MAQSSAPNARGSAEQVAQFGELASSLTDAAAAYAAAGEYDAEIDGMFRRLRVMTAALNAALAAVPMLRPPPAPVFAPSPAGAGPPSPPPGGRSP